MSLGSEPFGNHGGHRVTIGDLEDDGFSEKIDSFHFAPLNALGRIRLRYRFQAGGMPRLRH